LLGRLLGFLRRQQLGPLHRGQVSQHLLALRNGGIDLGLLLAQRCRHCVRCGGRLGCGRHRLLVVKVGGAHAVEHHRLTAAQLLKCRDAVHRV